MGSAAPTGAKGDDAGGASTPGLTKVQNRAAERIGKIAVTGRYHKTKTLTDDYNVNEKDVIGSGYNGSVYKAKKKEGADLVAVKDFKIRGANQEKMDELEAECEIFLSMDHPHVARLVDVYHTREKLSLVMELMRGGELFDRVLSKKKYSEEDAANAAFQMLLALNYIHSHGICHRDIKLENFLYESPDTEHLKLIDFGFSKFWDEKTRMKMACGTLAYVAPEVLSKSYTLACDMWSMGIVVFILLVGYMPFSGASESITVRNIKAGKFTEKEAYKKVSSQADDFIRKLICVDVAERMTAEKALEHPFIKDRSEMAKASEEREVEGATVHALVDFAKASKFRRALMSCMAWSLTNEQRTKLREAFLAMDKNNTGTITLGEFKAVLEGQKFGMDDAEVVTIFEAVDASHTEEIAYTEFLAAMVSSRIALHDDLLKATFRRFDRDGTGFIEAADLKELLGESFEGEEVENLLKEADANGDGKISYEEFIAYAQEGHESNEKLAKVGDKIVDTEIAKAHGSDTRPGPFKSLMGKLGM
jgi:calcium-dependent protein kinase